MTMNFQVSFHLLKDQINALIRIREKFDGRADEPQSVNELMSVARLTDIEQFRSLGLLEAVSDNHYGLSPWFDEVFDQLVVTAEESVGKIRAQKGPDLGGESVIEIVQTAILGITIVNARVLLKNSNIHEWAPQRILMEYIGSKIEG